eukprot:NODE_3563_length_391_cov_329.163743_g3011_i0.p2 GENE.NODE_3563_length_391_cov_329.163743_g3011_i0~~NODE_3563_length_391_cov_329.163743_g3011_i0.p2  ORF type:complete len:91 (-),score=19.47 NODE_3563_length_391_cov_329.163743_g3011_i0:119-364(-)
MGVEVWDPSAGVRTFAAPGLVCLPVRRVRIKREAGLEMAQAIRSVTAIGGCAGTGKQTGRNQLGCSVHRPILPIHPPEVKE